MHLIIVGKSEVFDTRKMGLARHFCSLALLLNQQDLVPEAAGNRKSGLPWALCIPVHQPCVTLLLSSVVLVGVMTCGQTSWCVAVAVWGIMVHLGGS